MAVGSGGEVERLRKLIEPRLLEVDLPELLIEVDGWTNFTGQLTPLSGNRSRSHEMPCVLYQAIVAQATNLGPTGMAARASTATSSSNGHGSSTAASRPSPPASAWLVNYHHQLPLTQAWGSGQLSSSDGQRFASRTRGPGTAALPRYFGHRRRGEPQAEEVEGAEHDLAIRNGVIGRVPAETFASPRLSDTAPAGPCLGAGTCASCGCPCSMIHPSVSTRTSRIGVGSVESCGVRSFTRA